MTVTISCQSDHVSTSNHHSSSDFSQPNDKNPTCFRKPTFTTKITLSHQNVILQTIAYLIPVLLVAVLIYCDGNNSNIILNSMIQKTELNPGLKALELVMNVSFMA